MKMLLPALLCLTMASPAFARDYYRPPDTSEQQRRAVEAARRNQQERLREISHREARRYRQSHQPRRQTPRHNTCGYSFWLKSEALNSCPPATAMKAYTEEGTPFYYCDCTP